MKKNKLTSLFASSLIAITIATAPFVSLAQGNDNNYSHNQKTETRASAKSGSAWSKFLGFFGARHALAATANHTPTISGITSPTIVKTGETGTWTVKASDPENQTLEYSVDWGDTTGQSMMKSALTPAFVQTSTFTHAYMAPGTYTVTFTVKDSAGLTTKSTVTVHIVGSPITMPVISNLSATSSKPQQATISWTTDIKSTSMIWYGTTSPTDTSADPAMSKPGKVLNHKFTLTNLDANTKYYVIIGSAGNGGTTMSDETSFTTAPEKNAPVITSLDGQSTIAAGETETVTINAYDPKNGSLTYSADWGDSASMMSLMKTAELPFTQTSTFTHVYAEPGTYTAIFTAENAAGKKASSSLTITVTPAPEDTTGPVISGTAISEIENATATISWTTDEPSTSKVFYSATTPVDTTASGAFIGDESLMINHSLDIADLKASTKYYFVIQSADASDNMTTGIEMTFTTTPADDATAPVITSHDNMTLAATSNGGVITTYESPAVTDDVDTGLTATCLPASGTLFPVGTTTVTCNAADSSGNNATATTFTVTVSDAIIPVISNTNATANSSSATITWTTDESASSKVFYSTTTPVDTTASGTSFVDATMVKDHSIVIPGLTASTTYHIVIQSTDTAGNVTTSSESTVTTSA